MQGGIFDSMGGTKPPLSADKFKEEIVQRYAKQADSIGIEACIGEAVDEIWPAPGYRAHQREAVVDILKQLYVDDCDVVTLSAPTGAGKSLILHGVIATLANEFGRNSFFTTPLNALIDQVDDDEFIGDEVITLKGKNNYQCVHPHDRGTPVDSAVCQRVDDFGCQYKNQHHESGGCPYYGRKVAAQNHPEVATNLSYLMANSMIPDTVDSKFDPRELVVIDECQSIEDFALQFIGVTVSDNSVPVVWDDIPLPPQTEEGADSGESASSDPEDGSASEVEQLADWLRDAVLPPVREYLSELDAKPELTEEESDNQEDLEQFARKVRNLVQDVRDNHWVANRDVDGDDWSVEFKPIFVGRFLERFLWSQGHKVVLSSATIPKGGFLEEIGLDDRQVGNVTVPSTFPPERRPVYTDDTVGKMTMRQRDQTIPKMARRIGTLADHYWDEGNFRGFVHCHSYKIMERIYEALPRDVRARTRCQDATAREASLEDWLDSPVDEEGYSDERGGQVFLSVAMDEGISLDDWRARWQVIAKAAYPYMGPEARRANYRMDELDDWVWYAGKAAINLQQAVGRGMRSQDDWCHTHVLDQSAATLIERNEYLMEDWFMDGVDETPTDDIPPRP